MRGNTTHPRIVLFDSIDRFTGSPTTQKLILIRREGNVEIKLHELESKGICEDIYSWKISKESHRGLFIE